MNTAAKLGAYALGLAVVFGGAFGAGKVVGPVGTPPAEDHAAMATATPAGDHAAMSTGSGEQVKGDTPGGLQVSQGGYTLNLITSMKAGVPADLAFTVIGPDGKPVTGYEVAHDKKLHLIVVSRDLTSFQHLHPEMAADGTWSVRLTLPEAGAYRVFADFAPTGGDGLTLGADLSVPGDYRPEALPRESRTATIDGYEVTLDGDLTPGQSSKLTLKVGKDGEPVTDLEPYLGAYGHLVALRARDLAYLHVHPEESEKAGPEIVFYAEVPSTGDYRLFLDFQHDGKVRTADFTLSAGERQQEPTPKPSPSAHGDDHSH
ncbi:hypothetical protein FXF51_32405 [Nonomuraea sp. PA05]|uniref:hypothetical protein n=1 Tax=Nonomuraea sp. PA05 TaxID=2604466 RepID=UPI0011D723B1|nr:hypothetical protein [Nonomuraea sp. PA05]TYB60289.1 hypothetical protein FXF51_32405 [Nonomuraea sp. PA05]